MPRVPREVMWSNHTRRSSASDSAVSATVRPSACAAAAAPRTISIAQGLSKSLNTTSITGGASTVAARLR